MNKEDYRLLSLSELSLIVLNNKTTDLIAEAEIKRRFHNNGCDYDSFLEGEEKTLSKRGEDPNNYLIWEGVTAQKVMETYFNYVHNSTLPYTLFSEVNLCNDNSKGTFFDVVLKIETNNLKNRIKQTSLNTEREKLELICNILKEQRNKENVWYENARTDAVYDICPKGFNFSEKRIKNMEKTCKGVSSGSKIALLKFYSMYPYLLLQDTEFWEYLGINKFSIADSMKLNRQKKKILNDLRYGKPVDYSFIDTKELKK